MRTFLRRYHLVMMAVWPTLSIPAVLWWKNSIIFVIALSLYANFAGDFAGYQGARAEEENSDKSQSSDPPTVQGVPLEITRVEGCDCGGLDFHRVDCTIFQLDRDRITANVDAARQRLRGYTAAMNKRLRADGEDHV